MASIYECKIFPLYMSEKYGAVFNINVRINKIFLNIHMGYRFRNMSNRIIYTIRERLERGSAGCDELIIYYDCNCENKRCVCGKKSGKFDIQFYCEQFQIAEDLLKEEMQKNEEEISGILKIKNLTFADIFKNPQRELTWYSYESKKWESALFSL